MANSCNYNDTLLKPVLPLSCSLKQVPKQSVQFLKLQHEVQEELDCRVLDQRALLPSTTGGVPNQQHSCGSQDLGPRIATPLQDRDKKIPEAAESYGQPEAPFDVSVMCIYIYIYGRELGRWFNGVKKDLDGTSKLVKIHSESNEVKCSISAVRKA